MEPVPLLFFFLFTNLVFVAVQGGLRSCLKDLSFPFKKKAIG